MNSSHLPLGLLFAFPHFRCIAQVHDEPGAAVHLVGHVLAVLENKLQDIQAALRSIEKGDYGICARCGNPIEPGRLEVKPDATLCITCQAEVERLSRRGRNTRQIQW